MAAKKTAASGSVKVRAYASPTLVLLALDWPNGRSHDDFLGFAIRRAPGYHPGEKDAYLWNKLSFAPPVEGSSPVPSDLAPIQKFLWWDSGITTEQRGKTFAYTVFPVLGTGPADLKLRRRNGQRRARSSCRRSRTTTGSRRTSTARS